MDVAHRREARRLLVALAGAAMLAFVALVHAPAEHGAFVWDDHVLAERDAPFRHIPLSKLFVGRFWPDATLADPRAPYYRPMVLLSLRFDAALGGDAAQHHLTNIGLHLTACALLVAAARRLGARAVPAVLAALLWGVAPRLTESVTWISGRTDILACAFGLGALAVAPRPSSTRGFGWIRAVLSGVLLMGALFSKEVGVAFAAALVALGWWPVAGEDEGARRSRRLHLLASAAAPLAIYAALRTIAIAGQSGVERDLGVALRAATVLESVGRYAEMTLMPLQPKTSIGYLGEPDPARAALGGLVLVASAGITLVHRRRLTREACTVLVLGTIALSLVIHVLPLALSGAVVADRLLYAPLTALAIAAALGAGRLPRALANAAGALVLALALVFANATRARVHDYDDEVLFWTIAAEQAHAHNTMPRNALAGLVRDAGRPDLACRLFETSRQILKESGRGGSRAHQRAGENLAACWARVGRYEDAVALADEVARAHPNVGRVHMGLGFARLHVRDFDGASSAFARAVALDAGLAKVVTRAVGAMPRVRQEAGTFAEPEARADKSAWANHLASLGRSREADEAFLAVAGDPSLPLPVRQSAIDFLVLEGNLDAAERVAPLTFTEIRRQALVDHVRVRRARRDVVDRLRPRVEKLAR